MLPIQRKKKEITNLKLMAHNELDIWNKTTILNLGKVIV